MTDEPYGIDRERGIDGAPQRSRLLTIIVGTMVLIVALAGAIVGSLGLVAFMLAGFGFSLSGAICLLAAIQRTEIVPLSRDERRRLSIATAVASILWFGAVFVGALTDELSAWLCVGAAPPVVVGTSAVRIMLRPHAGRARES
jgi:low temperature requirement protein LtrA